MGSEAGVDSEKVRALRELLPATSAGIYLDTATFGPLPAETAEAMRQAEDWELRVGRLTDGREEDVAQRAAEAQAVLAAALGADPASVLLAHGRDDALALAEELTGHRLEVVEHISSLTGALAPAAAAPAASGGKPRVIDLSNSVGAVPLAVADLGADAAVLAADRWLLGPEGAAALWLRHPPVDARSRALPRTTLVGTARSVGWLQMYVGLAWIHERTADLSARLHNALSAIPGVEVVTPAPPPAAIVSFRLTAWRPEEAAEELGRRVFALVRALPEQGLLRASVGWFNTYDEIDRFAGAVGVLGAHTPASLPRRPPLVVQ